MAHAVRVGNSAPDRWTSDEHCMREDQGLELALTDSLAQA